MPREDSHAPVLLLQLGTRQSLHSCGCQRTVYPRCSQGRGATLCKGSATRGGRWGCTREVGSNGLCNGESEGQKHQKSQWAKAMWSTLCATAPLSAAHGGASTQTGGRGARLRSLHKPLAMRSWGGASEPGAGAGLVVVRLPDIEQARAYPQVHEPERLVCGERRARQASRSRMPRGRGSECARSHHMVKPGHGPPPLPRPRQCPASSLRARVPAASSDSAGRR